MANHIKVYQREEDQSESLSSKEYQKLEGKLKQDYFLPQVTDLYEPEETRVLRVHELESNISKNKELGPNNILINLT